MTRENGLPSTNVHSVKGLKKGRKIYRGVTLGWTEHITKFIFERGSHIRISLLIP
jgi:hypothetical protein